MLRLLPLLLAFGSCNQLIKMADDSYYEKVDAKTGADHLKLVFSHNINGETHPCGCRKFPLGGLPQVAGYLHEASKDTPVVYVDSGDMLFPSPSIPETMGQSVKFTADKLVEAQELQKLRYFVPGDQDFALGIDYIEKLSKNSKIKIIATNMKESSPIKHKRWAAFKVGDKEVFLFGITDPSLLSGEARDLFTDPRQAIKKALAEIKPAASKKLVLLSHSGLDTDKSIAKSFPQFNWIIGAHSQSFLKEPETVGDTKIVQALSRNHYLGEISIFLNPKKKDSYRLVAMSEGVENKRPDNPMIPWLSAYKAQLDEIQKNEQKRLMADVDEEGEKLKTYLSCSECHKEQTAFWQKSAHSIAWQTLEKANASNNPQCIGCHSLGFQKPEGFATTASIVQGENFNEKKLQTYLAEVKSVFKNVKSIRELAGSERAKLSQKWIKIDEKQGVESNFANVQCLHCHSQSADHPFDIGGDNKKADYSEKCLNCHTADQSPEWYNRDQNGLATTPNKTYVERKIKELSCPQM